jgi:hypothetical protein
MDGLHLQISGYNHPIIHPTHFFAEGFPKMSSSLITILTLTSGLCWSGVYISILYRGFKDKTYGMPMFALAFNLSWEFIFAFLVNGGYGLQQVVNTVWFLLDAAIVFTYFRYGRREFPRQVAKYFLPWSLAAFGVAFGTIYFAAYQFEGLWGAAYTAFAQNLMMSILFIGMLVRRNSVEGQSMGIAILKWLGTLAPTIQAFALTGNKLILVLGIGIFFYDVIYIGMLYRKFVELRLNPFTRKPG